MALNVKASLVYVITNMFSSSPYSLPSQSWRNMKMNLLYKTRMSESLIFLQFWSDFDRVYVNTWNLYTLPQKKSNVSMVSEGAFSLEKGVGIKTIRGRCRNDLGSGSESQGHQENGQIKVAAAWNISSWYISSFHINWNVTWNMTSVTRKLTCSRLKKLADFWSSKLCKIGYIRSKVIYLVSK